MSGFDEFDEMMDSNGIIEISRKLTRALETGRSLRLSAEQLGILAEVGALALVSSAAADRLREMAVARRSARQARSPNAEPTREAAGATDHRARQRAREVFSDKPGK